MSLFTPDTFADLVTFTRASGAFAIAEDGTLASFASGAARLDWQAGSLLSGLSVQRRTLTLDRGQYSLAITGTGSVAVRIGGRVVATATGATRRRILVRADDTDVELTPKGSVTAWDMRKAMGLLVEPARTNLLLRSQEFDNASWTKLRSSISADSATAPDGTTTADTLVEDSTATSTHQASQSFAVSASATVTQSLFVRAGVGSARNLRMVIAGNVSSNIASAIFSTSTGAVLFASVAVLATTARNIGGGWWRFSLTIAMGASDSFAEAIIQMADGTNAFYTGDGSSGLYIWGSQFEVGAYPGSYIATTTATVNRPADVATIIDADDYYAATGNSLTIAATAPAGLGTQVLAQWDDGDESDRVRVVRDASGDLRVIVTAGSAEQANLSLGAVANSAFFSLSLRWMVNGFAASLNGAAEVTDSSGSLPAGITTLRLGADSAGSQWGGHIAYITPRPRVFDTTQNRGMAA
ncbi:phage head spike fiber domain-containing protein [Oceanibaculum indicum]|uniref:Uncharacterized protein n=1 Tax=Oceanibaculum indicum TaxID=526216 RepID=A0A420WGK0_9PROT|nr:hypothetical protein [Oceanibaculum indicum]RKQ70113.1 hypothetical protein BCL74_2052 [Oceanibaculum indicum]